MRFLRKHRQIKQSPTQATVGSQEPTMQESSADFHRVPVVEVGADNLQELWPSLLLAVKSASFIALDLELSGLGDRRQINAKSIEDRYKAMCEVARTRSVLSLGLSCFKLLLTGSQPDGSKPTSFSVQTFNIQVLCSENYVVEPMSLKFLVEHGFDFNKQYATGLPYYRGRDKEDEQPVQCVRQLFCELVTSSAPVVFHNALVDLIFMYQSFYANLPAQMSTFLADLSELYAGGVFDTKYITEFKARMQASYLGYVFRRCQRENSTRDESGQSSARLSFLSYPANTPAIIYMPCSLDTEKQVTGSTASQTCRHYAAHGWCAQSSECPNSHNIDLILDNETGSSAKKRKKKRHKKVETSPKITEEEPEATSGTDSVEIDTLANSLSNVPEMKDKDSETASELPEARKEPNFAAKTGGHRAGFDAFMTGFTFAVYVTKFGKMRLLETENTVDLGMEEFKNRVSLSGKDIPLHIVKSNFAKTSREHREKMVKLKPGETG